MKTTIETHPNKSNFKTCKTCHKQLEYPDGITLLFVDHGTHGTSTDSTLFCNDCAMKVAEVLQKAVVQNARAMIAPALKTVKKAKSLPQANPAFKNITLNDVRSVYSGQAHTCMCGCSGKYYYASAYRVESGTRRGYDVTDEEISDKMVKRVFNIISTAKDVDTDGECLSTIIENRLYVLWLES